MCFSAGASFGAGIVLSAIGIASIKKVQSPSQIIFASIPFIFSVQQITEGFLWLILENPVSASMQQITTYIFLFFAQIVWPIWIPLAVFLLEKVDKRKKMLEVFVGTGLLMAFCLAYCLLMFNVQAKIIGYHIKYLQGYPPGLKMYGVALYVIATIPPLFFSSINKMWIFGIAILISYIITAIFYKEYVLSVWCFFASVISVMVFIIMREMEIANKKIPTMAV